MELAGKSSITLNGSQYDRRQPQHRQYHLKSSGHTSPNLTYGDPFANSSLKPRCFTTSHSETSKLVMCTISPKGKSIFQSRFIYWREHSNVHEVACNQHSGMVWSRQEFEGSTLPSIVTVSCKFSIGFEKTLKIARELRKQRSRMTTRVNFNSQSLVAW
jgi:hypothetical protein